MRRSGSRAEAALAVLPDNPRSVALRLPSGARFGIDREVGASLARDVKVVSYSTATWEALADRICGAHLGGPSASMLDLPRTPMRASISPDMRTLDVGADFEYEGELNAAGEREGRGRLRYPGGDVYAVEGGQTRGRGHVPSTSVACPRRPPS